MGRLEAIEFVAEDDEGRACRASSRIFARLRPGVTSTAAIAELDQIWTRLAVDPGIQMRIRAAGLDDLDFVLSLAPRLVEFGNVPGRDAAQMIARDRDVLRAALEAPSADTELFVAEADDGARLGLIHLTTAGDYYSDRDTAHIADVVVATEAGGRGVGRALIAFAEDWARSRGFALLTLNVFSANRRARDLYGRLGFEEEWIRCIKRLQS
jgi:ribosomal protein S18 acetylase RimI-like enzyme